MDTITIDGMIHRMWLSTDRSNARKLTGYCQCCDWRISNATNRQAVASFTDYHTSV